MTPIIAAKNMAGKEKVDSSILPTCSFRAPQHNAIVCANRKFCWQRLLYCKATERRKGAAPRVGGVSKLYRRFGPALRERMTSDGASGAIAPHSNRVSGDYGLRCRETGFPGKKRQYVPNSRLRCRETGFPGQRKMRQYVARTTGHWSQRPSGRTRSPPIPGLSQPLQEISATAGMRGGPGRIRTSNQTVMSGRPGSTRVRSTGVARKSPGPTDANGGHTR
jgi:hypothetical protein